MASTEELMSELVRVIKKVEQLDYIKTKIHEFGKSLEFLNAKYDEQSALPLFQLVADFVP